jgi:hypothetical protein
VGEERAKRRDDGGPYGFNPLKNVITQKPKTQIKF